MPLEFGGFAKSYNALLFGSPQICPSCGYKIRNGLDGVPRKKMVKYVETIQSHYYNESRKLPKVVYDWDRSLGLESWGSEIRHSSASLGIDINSNDGDIFSLTDAYNIFLNQNRAIWQSEAHRKPKLQTFVQIHDFDSNQLLVKSGLTRYQRSLLSQLKFGILPLKIETDRYQGIPSDRRICKLCDLNTPEDEAHFPSAAQL